VTQRAALIVRLEAMRSRRRRRLCREVLDRRRLRVSLELRPASCDERVEHAGGLVLRIGERAAGRPDEAATVGSYAVASPTWPASSALPGPAPRPRTPDVSPRPPTPWPSPLAQPKPPGLPRSRATSRSQERCAGKAPEDPAGLRGSIRKPSNPPSHPTGERVRGLARASCVGS
jgi:hypothetical protein